MSTTALTTPSNSRGSDFELAYASPVVSQHVLEGMGADMASLHRHNSKNNIPRALNDETGKPGNDGRKRRSNGSSDDEGKIAEDGFSNEDLRVGGPYLCSIPLSSQPVPETNPAHNVLRHKVSGGETIFDRVYRILRNRDISVINRGPWDHPVTLCYHQSKFDPEPERVPTIVILATRHVVDDLWLETARQIYSLLRHENFRQVSVEIIDPQARHPPRTLPVLKSDPMFNKWDSVLHRILGVVDLTDIQHIGCYRRGRNSGSDNPVTVLVIADVNSKKSWRPTREMIAGILKRSNLPMVAVEIVKDRRTLFMDPKKFVDLNAGGFQEELLKGRAIAGGPIAHSRNDAGSGTLGGFIELQHPETLEWYCFALTCFHVINPRDRDLTGRERAAVETWRNRGLSLLQTESSEAEVELAQQCLKTSHPSQRAKQEQIEINQASIKSTKNDTLYKHGLLLMENDLFDTELSEPRKETWRDFQSEIMDYEKRTNDIKAFFQNSNNILGFVRGASGFRSKKIHTLEGIDHPTNLDWALIKVDVKKWHPSNKRENRLAMKEMASSETFSDLVENDLSTQLEFQGYRSGRNTVLYNGLKTAEIEDGVETLEYSIAALNQSKPALAPGDSGSLLCTFAGRVVGMIIAGYENNQIGRFMRIDDLVNDIMEQSGAKGIRLWRN